MILGSGPIGAGRGLAGVRYLHSRLLGGCTRGHLGSGAWLLDALESFLEAKLEESESQKSTLKEILEESELQRSTLDAKLEDERN